MARHQDRLFVGIRDVVVALDPKDGSELWRSKVGNGGFVNVLWDGEVLIASSKGEIFRLDPQHGSLLWHNKLKGLGMGLVALASSRVSSGSGNVAASEQARRAAAAAASEQG